MKRLLKYLGGIVIHPKIVAQTVFGLIVVAGAGGVTQALNYIGIRPTARAVSTVVLAAVIVVGFLKSGPDGALLAFMKNAPTNLTTWAQGLASTVTQTYVSNLQIPATHTVTIAPTASGGGVTTDPGPIPVPTPLPAPAPVPLPDPAPPIIPVPVPVPDAPTPTPQVAP